jgi:RNA polymerase sigma-70 factor (ECF subfamily)
LTLPDTNPLLIVRLRNAADEQALFEFVELYRPAIVRSATQKGFQSADAEDLAQAVLVSVAGAIGTWEPDDDRGRFRTWLYTIADRHVIDALRRRSRSKVADATSVGLEDLEIESRREDSRLLRTELKREAFLRAASAVKEEFSSEAWAAFWETSIEGRSAREIAIRSGKTIGAVHAARSRIMRRLIQRVRARRLSGCDERD